MTRQMMNAANDGEISEESFQFNNDQNQRAKTRVKWLQEKSLTVQQIELKP